MIEDEDDVCPDLSDFEVFIIEEDEESESNNDRQPLRSENG